MTKLTFLIAHLTAAPHKIKAPEVLTDVALLWVEIAHYPERKIFTKILLTVFNLAITNLKASVKLVTKCKIYIKMLFWVFEV